MLKKPFWLGVAWTLLCWPAAARAWNETGHMLTAAIAYERLDPATRAKLVDILKQHPRFNDDFVRQMPPSVKDADKDRWIFIHAATWPDIARGFKGRDRRKYHHPTWHYINKPIFLSAEDEETLKEDLEINLVEEWKPGQKHGALNILQAIEKCKADFNADGAEARDKAVALCWLLHLIGDVHQPLHAATFFSSERFEEGDRGGNLVPTKNKSLHTLWDGLLGEGKSLTVLTKRIQDLFNDPERLKQGEQALAAKTPREWVAESYKIAFEFIYDEKVRKLVKQGEEKPDEPLPPVEYSENHTKKAKEIALRRAVEAGFRLSEFLKTLSL